MSAPYSVSHGMTLVVRHTDTRERCRAERPRQPVAVRSPVRMTGVEVRWELHPHGHTRLRYPARARAPDEHGRAARVPAHEAVPAPRAGDGGRGGRRAADGLFERRLAAYRGQPAAPPPPLGRRLRRPGRTALRSPRSAAISPSAPTRRRDADLLAGAARGARGRSYGSGPGPATEPEDRGGGARPAHAGADGCAWRVEQLYLHAALDGLLPGTTYYYGVGHDGFDPASRAAPVDDRLVPHGAGDRRSGSSSPPSATRASAWRPPPTTMSCCARSPPSTCTRATSATRTAPATARRVGRATTPRTGTCSSSRTSRSRSRCRGW